ncbi:MAG: serine hydrolase [Planctomycetaceae bacterium]|nr:serine hydrolase [Planctomycetaceae bacterium]MDG2388467.1 serine hydrolase [Planctomycetaceae bacterium]
MNQRSIEISVVYFCLATILLNGSVARADVRLPRLFGDNLVLQQQSKNAVWGWSAPGEIITISASWGATESTKADIKGRWKLFLETPSHAMGQSLTIAGDNTIKLSNVAIGEVWICAGQSNMGWSTGNSFEAEKESDVDLPGFRIFKSQREHWHEPLEESRDRLQQWKPCNPQSAAETSAVSYYFGKTLHQHLGVPVGIIVQAYAGTPIEGWMPWEIQKDDPRAVEQKYVLDQNAERIIKRGETVEKALAMFKTQLAEYDTQIDAGETMKNAFRQLQPPFITKPASLGHQYPAHIFNAMIYPVRPYGIRGMIWYQGERNSKNVPQAVHYRKQMANLIHYYRSSWHALSGSNVDKSFPIQLTQLPSWNPIQTQPVEGDKSPWPANRESMRLVSDEIEHTGLVVSIDTGDEIELHPKNKKPLGIRHALIALQQTYGRDIVGSGPRYIGHKIDDQSVILKFQSIGSGLTAARPGKLDAFAIAGEDRKWHWARGEVQGDTVIVSSDEIPMPVAVRYAWAMNPSQRNLLYNKEGLPASPFRTDTWPLFHPSDKLIEVDKPQKPDGYRAIDWDRPVMAQASLVAEDSSVSNGLAPEITDLNAEDVSYALEAKLPDLKEPYINATPDNREDGITVGKLGMDGGDKDAILKFATENSEGEHGEVDSFLLSYRGKLLFESYYRRGRINYPHYQMSITKSYTAMAIGRAIQLGYLTLADLDKPIVSFLKELDQSQLAPGASKITLAEAMNMRSGIRLSSEKIKDLLTAPESFQGQGQIQAYLQHTTPIPESPREFKYQGSDPSITMQVLEAVVPGSAREFIASELLGKMGITSFAWQNDVSGLPKSAAGSSLRSRDMLKWGMLVLNEGKWNGEQLIPAEYVRRATSRIHTNRQNTSYGYFWWRHNMEMGDRTFDCISGRGAGGQFIFILPELQLIGVITAHNKGMGTLLKDFPEKVVSAFIKESIDLKIRQLPATVRDQTKLLNVDYLVSCPKEVKGDTKLPILIFLHGAGGRGTKIQKVKGIARHVKEGLETFVDEPCFFVAPQATVGTTDIPASWLPEDLDRFLAHLKDTLSIDGSRIYLTGNSMGGYGTWAWAAHSPEQFAAVAPVVGGLGKGGPKDITRDLDRWADNLATIPVWAFHGANDKVVPADRSKQMVELIRQKGGTQARLTIYPEEGHGASQQVYNSQEFFKWMFTKKKKTNEE